jgi:hypothetical protein
MSDDNRLVHFGEASEFDLLRAPLTETFTTHSAIDSTMSQDYFPALPAFLAFGPGEHGVRSTESAADLCGDFGFLPNYSVDLGEREEEIASILDIESGMHESEAPYVRL